MGPWDRNTPIFLSETKAMKFHLAGVGGERFWSRRASFPHNVPRLIRAYGLVILVVEESIDCLILDVVDDILIRPLQ